MKIGEIIKSSQIGVYDEFIKIQNQSKLNNKLNEHLSFSDIEELMKHSSYVRGKGGAIRQVRYK